MSRNSHDARGRSTFRARLVVDNTNKPASKPKRKSKARGEVEQHSRIPNWLVDMPAFGDLAATSIKVYVFLIRRLSGVNNGAVVFAARQGASQCRLDKDTVSKALRELEAAGFIENMRHGSYSPRARLASEWRITHLPCNVSGRPPSLIDPAKRLAA
jgi:hypothetical protein